MADFWWMQAIDDATRELHMRVDSHEEGTRLSNDGIQVQKIAVSRSFFGACRSADNLAVACRRFIASCTTGLTSTISGQR